ncbi:Peptidase family M50 [Pseudarcicella hirudinis]|uniref:Peptidase family M50 n=1 Tax=Pseudarcicella hirudinis TaxID=1079859 RepID=A0A1I5MGH6_9BACT|nr:site-2 protease family protein [Pseudarcicella hirudinis]SFP08695.1 Peptidase family M50 [Pseudarcicella hirudinis]
MNRKTVLIQIILFIVTLITTTFAGAEWMTGRYFFYPFIGDQLPEAAKLHLDEIWQGLQYSLPFIGILTAHEFGHFFTARHYKIRATLPYYIPVWFSSLGFSIGTMGAVIRILDRTKSRLQYFDIGIAGPLAGFVVAFGVLWYGFTHLPPAHYIFSIHPEYMKYGLDYAKHVYDAKNMSGSLVLGDNLLFWFFKKYVADPALLPNIFEITHYPFLMAGYLALFFTALNLIPIGQLDGGHILYGLIGKKWFNRISPVLFIIFTTYSGYGLFTIQGFSNAESDMDSFMWLVIYIFFLQICFSRINPENRMTSWVLALAVTVFQIVLSYFLPAGTQGFSGFLLFVFLLGRILGVYHPEVEIDEPLDWKRKLLGWISLLIFILCFSPQPFMQMP